MPSLQKNKLPFTIILLCLGLFLLYAVFSDGILDEGDAVMHFLIARYSFAHPHLLLDLWGKPLFTLLSAPFTLIGFNGLIVFNALLAAGTSFLIYKIALVYKFRNAWLVIIILLFSPVYFKSILAGHTEILCSFSFTLTVYLFSIRRYATASVIASLLPFARPEGYIILCFVFFTLVFLKKPKYIPLLFIGMLVYSVAGWFHFRDILWVFHNNPYDLNNDLYGHGDPWHFIRSYRGIVGNPVVFVLAAGMLAYLLSFMTKRVRKYRMDHAISILMFGSFAGVLSVHSYIWWKGLFGSFGLIRVIACVLPALVVFWLIGWNVAERYVLNRLSKIKKPVLLLYLSLVLYVPLKNYRFPIRPSSQEALMNKAAKWYNQQKKAHDVLYFLHPYLIYKLGADPFDPRQSGMLWSLNKKLPGNNLKPGSLIFWDGKFAPVEAGIELENMESDSTLECVKIFKPEMEILEMWGTPFEIYVFRKSSYREPE